MEGRAEGRVHTLIELASDGLLSLSEAAARAKLSEQEFTKAAEEYRRHSGTYSACSLPKKHIFTYKTACIRLVSAEYRRFYS